MPEEVAKLPPISGPLPTIKVTHLESGDEMIINKTDFDPELHEKAESKPVRRAALKRKDDKDDKGKPEEEDKK